MAMVDFVDFTTENGSSKVVSTVQLINRLIKEKHKSQSCLADFATTLA
jgi:hypothetical protein